MPTAVGQSGKGIWIEHNGTSISQVYTLNTTSGQTIGGIASGSYALATNTEFLQLVSDGANWQIAAHNTNTTPVSSTIFNTYTFTVASGSYSGTAGAQYSNNGNTYILATTFTTAATSIVMVGTAPPQASGTLTIISGTHVGNPVYSSFSGSASLIGATTNQPVYNTSPTTNTVYWSRSGKYATIVYQFNQTSGGTVNGSGDFLLTLPAGLTIDTSSVPAYTGSVGTTLQSVAAATPSLISSYGQTLFVQTTAALLANAYVYSTTQFRVSFWYDSAGAVATATFGGTSVPSTDLQFWNFQVTVPISGWQP